MREYLIKRFLLLIPTFLGITLVVYSVLLLLPGDPVDVLLGQEYDAQIAAKLRAEWGLDDPIIVQYGKWLWHIVQGDWGRSMFSRKPVFNEVINKLPLTLQLIALALFFEIVISVPAGGISGVKTDNSGGVCAPTLSPRGAAI